MIELLQKIRAAKTMNEINDLREVVVLDKNEWSLQAWQKKYRGLKYSRKLKKVIPA